MTQAAESMTARRPTSTDVILVLAPLMWSLHIVGSKYSLSNGFLPMPYLIIRFVSAAVVFVIIALFVERSLRIDGRSDRLHVAGAALAFTANQIAFVYALKATTAVTVSLVFGLFPITVGVLAAAIGHEAMTRQKLFAGLVSFVGVSLVVIGIPGGMSKLSGEIWGILIALCIPLSWAFFSLLIGPPMKRHTPMRINAVVLPATAIAMLAIGFSSLDNQDYESPTPLAWICLAYSALGTLVLTNLLWFKVVGRVGAAKSSYFLNIQPFGAALLAWLLLGETITLVQVIGGIGIAAGIVISRVRVGSPTPLE
jgi:drug/metabolite transporter (DMT)-like permease